MRNIMFYPRSRNITPHIDEEGTVHIPISEWAAMRYIDHYDLKMGMVSSTTGRKTRKALRAFSPASRERLLSRDNYPTNGTSHPGQ